jgi:hypothetical protein
MSPRRLGEKSRLWCYRYLAIRDGESCKLCGALPVTRNNRFNVAEILEIDHVDGDPWNWLPENLRLLCKKCNLAERNLSSCSPQGDSARKERDKKEGCVSTRVVRTAVDYSHPEAPVTMQANFLFEVDFRTWLLQLIRDEGHHPREDAVFAGAEKVGCSPQATRSYLKKLTSSLGPLQERKDMLGGWMLEFKAESRQGAFVIQESHQAQSKKESDRPALVRLV